MTEDFAAFFKTLSTEEIRRRQSLTDQQIERAYKQRNSTALARLHTISDHLTAEMFDRC